MEDERPVDMGMAEADPTFMERFPLYFSGLIGCTSLALYFADGSPALYALIVSGSAVISWQLLKSIVIRCVRYSMHLPGPTVPSAVWRHMVHRMSSSLLYSLTTLTLKRSAKMSLLPASLKIEDDLPLHLGPALPRGPAKASPGRVAPPTGLPLGCTGLAWARGPGGGLLGCATAADAAALPSALHRAEVTKRADPVDPGEPAGEPEPDTQKPFQPGDIVECVLEQPRLGLCKGARYTIMDVCDTWWTYGWIQYVSVKHGERPEHSHMRFKLISSPRMPSPTRSQEAVATRNP
jgi:hypothetical protein